jgi:hypothetical protein
MHGGVLRSGAAWLQGGERVPIHIGSPQVIKLDPGLRRDDGSGEKVNRRCRTAATAAVNSMKPRAPKNLTN